MQVEEEEQEVVVEVAAVAVAVDVVATAAVVAAAVDIAVVVAAATACRIRDDISTVHDIDLTSKTITAKIAQIFFNTVCCIHDLLVLAFEQRTRGGCPVVAIKCSRKEFSLNILVNEKFCQHLFLLR